MESKVKGFPKDRHSEKACFESPISKEILYETPPTFIWNRCDDAKEYTVTVRTESGETVFSLTTSARNATPTSPLAPGKYIWNVVADSGEVRGDDPFEISEDALVFIRPTANELWESIPSSRPRHLFSVEDIPTLLEEREIELKTLERNVQLAYSCELPPPPDYHKDKNATPYRIYFGKFRDVCDRDLVATALKYALTDDERAGAHAKEILLTVCNNILDEDRYLTAGTLEPAFGDEVGLSLARCLPAALDLLFPLLTKQELDTVSKTVYIYGNACRQRLKNADYVNNPANSHAGRLPAYLGEAAVALKGLDVAADEELCEWISEALDIYCGIFPYYGGADGSWAEGAFYASSYSKWYLPFFSIVERFTKKSLMQRPFYHRFTNFLIHFVNPKYEIHPFGDGYWCTPDSPEWPGFFAQNPFRIYSERFGPEYARELSRLCEKQEYYKLHLLDLFLPSGTASQKSLSHEPKNAEIFPYGGFCALHTDLYSDDDITVLARASRFGSDSHRHADQGSFAIFLGGTALVSPSGYFGFKFGTNHHREWTNSTKAHNTLLFDGKGQPQNSMYSRGSIVDFNEEERSVTLDLSDAYPNISRFTRKITLASGLVTVDDEVESECEVDITYPVHTLGEPVASADGSVRVSRGGALLDIVPTQGDLRLLEISDRFDVDLNDGVAPELAVNMPQQYHVYFKAPKKHSHKIRVEYKIKKQ